jgi:DNA modification methylase
MNLNQCYFGDCVESMRQMPNGVINTCITSPPYFGLRDYGHAGQIGIEETPEQFIAKLVDVFREVKRLLRDDGTLWVNMGDSYAGSGKGRNGDGTPNVDINSKQATSAGTTNGVLVKTKTPDCKPKDLIGIPWMLAFALRADGWYLRQDIIWAKPNPMPESVTDRCTKIHEYIFLFSKSRHYFYDADAIKEPAIYAGDDRGSRTDSRRGTMANSMSGITGDFRNKRSVWSVPTSPYSGAHFAVFPPELIEPCVLAGAPVGGIVLDPFFGSGTTGEVAQRLGRNYVGCELNEAYKPLQKQRTQQPSLVLECV